MTAKVIFLTSGSSWTVPSDWNSSNNTIECIGGGCDADNGGGNGGCYAKISNLALTPGNNASYSIGSHGVPAGSTWFNSTGTVLATGGQLVYPATTAGCVGTTKYAGGNGYGSVAGISTGGGGGAAGPNGPGVDADAYGNGGAGDNGNTGNAGATGTQNGSNGGAGSDWTATAGGTAGSGGGGGAGSPVSGGNGGKGGSYGGGGGDAWDGGAGANGIIVITYTPIIVAASLNPITSTAASSFSSLTLTQIIPRYFSPSGIISITTASLASINVGLQNALGTLSAITSTAAASLGSPTFAWQYVYSFGTGVAGSAPVYVSSGTLAQTSGATTITPAFPSTVNSGDLLICQISVDTGSSTVETITPPSGWTRIGTAENNSGNTYTTTLFYHVYAPGDVAGAFTWSGSVDADAQISRFTGAATPPIGAVGAWAGGTATPCTSTAINTTANNSLAVLFAQDSSNVALTLPSGWTSGWNNYSSNWGGDLSGVTKAIPTSGTSSGATSSAYGTYWFSIQIELLGTAGVAGGLNNIVSAGVASLGAPTFVYKLIYPVTPSNIVSIATATLGTPKFPINQSLSGVTGSFSATLSSLNAEFQFSFKTSGGSFAIAGSAAVFGRALWIAGGSANYSITDSSAPLKIGLQFPEAAGSFALTGDALSVNKGNFIAPAPSAFSLTGAAAKPTLGIKLNEPTGNFSLSSTVKEVKGFAFNVSSGTFALLGSALGEIKQYQLSSANGVFSASYTTAKIGFGIAAPVGSFALSGTVGFFKSIGFGGAAGAFSLSGHAVTLSRNSIPDELFGTPAAFSFSGADATTIFHAKVPGVSAVFTLTGESASINATRLNAWNPGSFALSFGSGPKCALHLYLPTATFTLTEVVTGAKNKTLAGTTASFALSGNNIGNFAARELPAAHGIFGLSYSVAKLPRALKTAGPVDALHFTWDGASLILQRYSIAFIGLEPAVHYAVNWHNASFGKGVNLPGDTGVFALTLNKPQPGVIGERVKYTFTGSTASFSGERKFLIEYFGDGVEEATLPNDMMEVDLVMFRVMKNVEYSGFVETVFADPMNLELAWNGPLPPTGTPVYFTRPAKKPLASPINIWS